jgi:serine O-acetyltransferase
MAILSTIKLREDSIAIVGWEEGHAGQVDSWFEASGLGHVACFVHPEDFPPAVDALAALRGRAVKRFDVPTETSFKGAPLLSASDWPSVIVRAGIRRALVLLSDARRRQAEISRARHAGIVLASACHPSALVMPDAELGENVVLHARAYVGYRAEVHDGAIVNVGAQIDHHSALHRCATMDPGAVVAGNVTIGERAHVHAGAIVINRIRIGEDAIVGAGAVVIRDVEAGAKVVGNPARRIN